MEKAWAVSLGELPCVSETFWEPHLAMLMDRNQVLDIDFDRKIIAVALGRCSVNWTVTTHQGKEMPCRSETHAHGKWRNAHPG